MSKKVKTNEGGAGSQVAVTRGERTKDRELDVLRLYQNLVATIKGVEVKGKTLPYTSLNGNMFSALYQDGTVGLRLPEDERAKFIKKYNTGQPKQHGAVLKEYVIVPFDLLKKTSEAKKYFQLAYEYVQRLKAKK